MKSITHFAPGLTCIEDVIDAHGEIYDATILQKVADCPRAHEIRVEHNLDRPSPSAPMVAGIAVHYGLEYYYACSEPTPEDEAHAIRLMGEEWDTFKIDRATMDPKYVHLSKEHLGDVMRNYFNHWNRQRVDVFRPMGGLHFDELDMSEVLAAQFYITDNEEIILGESKLVMLFDVQGEEFMLAGKPDLPVRKQNGSVWVMDHKSTNANLGAYWSRAFEVSNKMRGYMAMVRSLLGGEELSGAVINGLLVGKNALNPNSKALKFERYQFDFTPDHVNEALRNQLAWRKTIDFYRAEGYFPQACAYGGCTHPDLCRRDPPNRAAVMADETKYVQSTRTFWSL